MNIDTLSNRIQKNKFFFLIITDNQFSSDNPLCNSLKSIRLNNLITEDDRYDKIFSNEIYLLNKEMIPLLNDFEYIFTKAIDESRKYDECNKILFKQYYQITNDIKISQEKSMSQQSKIINKFNVYETIILSIKYWLSSIKISCIQL